MSIKNASQNPDQTPVLPGSKPETSAEEFLEKHGKKIILLAILIIAAIGISFFRKANTKKYLQESGEKLVAAQTTEELEAVVTDYPDSPAAGNALLLLADRQLTNGNPGKAKDTLSKFVKAHSTSPVYYNGVFALGTVYEKLGQPNEATKQYQEIIGAGEKASTGAAAALRLADLIQDKGDLEGALAAYNEIAKNYPGSVFIEENGIVEERIASVDQAIILRDNPPPAPEPAAVAPTPPKEPAPAPPKEPAPTPPKEPAPTPPKEPAPTPPKEPAPTPPKEPAPTPPKEPAPTPPKEPAPTPPKEPAPTPPKEPAPTPPKEPAPTPPKEPAPTPPKEPAPPE
jgi:predicted negative regulator of RcsB-dependent stress response